MVRVSTVFLVIVSVFPAQCRNKKNAKPVTSLAFEAVKVERDSAHRASANYLLRRRALRPKQRSPARVRAFVGSGIADMGGLMTGPVPTLTKPPSTP